MSILASVCGAGHAHHGHLEDGRPEVAYHVVLLLLIVTRQRTTRYKLDAPVGKKIVPHGVGHTNVALGPSSKEVLNP